MNQVLKIVDEELGFLETEEEFFDNPNNKVITSNGIIFRVN